MNDIDTSNFADNTTSYACDVNLESVLGKVEENSEVAVIWFEKNYMKLNTDKCHLIVSGKSYENVWVKLGKDRIWKSNNFELLGVKIDNEFKLNKHISNACLKANNKLSALTRLSSSFPFEKRKPS